MKASSEDVKLWETLHPDLKQSQVLWLIKNLSGNEKIGRDDQARHNRTVGEITSVTKDFVDYQEIRGNMMTPAYGKT